MGRTGVAIAMLFAATSLCACDAIGPKLNSATIERAIEQDAHTQFADAHAIVGKASCPANREQKQGDQFKCHVKIDGQTATYVVPQPDGHGPVRPTLRSRYLLFSTINDQTLAN